LNLELLTANKALDERKIRVQEATTEQLLKRARIGDKAAFGDLQKRYEARIRHFASRMIHNHEVDDIVQRAFIALYINLERIEPVEKLLPFLYRVTRNLCYDSLRQYYRRDEMDIEDCDYRLATSTISPEDKAHWSLLLEEVRKHIDCLPEIQRDTLILYVEENLSHAEIADIMNTEIGTVKSRIFYARKLLRQMLSPDLLEILHKK